MRLRLTFKQVQPAQVIPINYQYYISSFIYRTIESSDGTFSKWLHDSGVKLGNKKFKFFNFSQLYIPSREIIKDKNLLRINSVTMDLIVSIMIDETANKFVIGMFENQKVKIMSGNSEAEFIIRSAELLPEPEFKNEMFFKTISPAVLTKKGIYKRKEAIIFLQPSDSDYFQYFKSNIESKYLAWCQFTDTIVREYKLEDLIIWGDVRTKLITIKEGKDEETKVRGCIYNFKLKGDKEFLQFAYNTGIGKWNSLGFGCIAPA